MSTRKTTLIRRNYYLSEIEKIHPFKSIVLLFNVISTIILCFLVFNFEIKYASAEAQTVEFHLPDVFFIGTLILFSTLLISNKQIQLYRQENVKKLKSNYYLQLFVSSIFIVIQMFAVYQFQLKYGTSLSDNFNSFFILMTSFHLVYMILAIVLTILILFRLVNVMEDPIKTLVYETNPFERLLIEIKQILWNFQAGLWVVIFLYFLVRF